MGTLCTRPSSAHSSAVRVGKRVSNAASMRAACGKRPRGACKSGSLASSGRFSMAQNDCHWAGVMGVMPIQPSLQR